MADFTKEARKLLAGMGYGPHPDEDVSVVAEALRAVAQREWDKGYEAGLEDGGENLTGGPSSPRKNPHTKPNQG